MRDNKSLFFLSGVVTALNLHGSGNAEKLELTILLAFFATLYFKLQNRRNEVNSIILTFSLGYACGALFNRERQALTTLNAPANLTHTPSKP